MTTPETTAPLSRLRTLMRSPMAPDSSGTPVAEISRPDSMNCTRTVAPASTAKWLAKRGGGDQPARQQGARRHLAGGVLRNDRQFGEGAAAALEGHLLQQIGRDGLAGIDDARRHDDRFLRANAPGRGGESGRGKHEVPVQGARRAASYLIP